jgi:hypothetical protein
VLEIPVGPRIDENADRDGHLAARDQLVDDRSGANVAVGIEVQVPVLEHHERGQIAAGVLRGDVHPIAAAAARVLEYQRATL